MKTLLLALGAAFFGFACTTTPSASSEADAQPSIEAQNKARAREFTEVVFNQQKLDRLADFVAEDFVDHSPGAPPLPHGVEMVRKQAIGSLKAFPDLRFEILHLIAEDDLVLIHWRSTGQHSVARPTGERPQVSIEGQSLFRMRDGKITESWDIVDRASMFKQLGFQISPPEWMKPPAGQGQQ